MSEHWIFWTVMALAAIFLLRAWRVDRRSWKLERDGSVNERMKRL